MRIVSRGAKGLGRCVDWKEISESIILYVPAYLVAGDLAPDDLTEDAGLRQRHG